MQEKIITEIVDLYFGECKDKINKKECLSEFYSSFTKKDLQKILGIYLLIKDDISLLEEVPYEEKSNKESVINYLQAHYKEIYKTIFYTIEDTEIFQLKRLIKNKGYEKLNSLVYSINFIDKLKRYKLAKINYDTKTKILEIHVPTDLLKLLKELISDPQIKKERKYITNISSTTKMILKPYGLLSLKKITEIINKIFFQIDEEELERVLNIKTITDDDLHIFEYNKEKIVTNSSFEEIEDAIEFYESLDDSEYKIFTKEEYLNLKEEIYHCQFREYDELLEYLCFNLDIEGEQLENFEEWFILDYLSSYQGDDRTANKNLIINLERSYPELSFQEKAIIKKKISNLAKLYPIYSLKGYSIKEKEK